MKNDPLHCEEANEEIHCPYASYLSAINMLSSLIEDIIFLSICTQDMVLCQLKNVRMGCAIKFPFLIRNLIFIIKILILQNK